MHDAQELTELIKDTPNMIARHRVHAEKGGVGYSDTPTVGEIGRASCRERV